jgi:hypothetical protein
MERNDLIVRTAYSHIAGGLLGPRDEKGRDVSGRCLQLTRIILEAALGLEKPPGGGHAWYRWLTHPVPRPVGAPPARTDPWARDMERSLRLQGMAVIAPEPEHRYIHIGTIMDLGKPGDLIFRFDTALHPLNPKNAPDPFWIGHIGILMPGNLILENINPLYRKPGFGMSRGPTRLTPLGEWPVTLVVRFDPDALPS